MISENYTFKKCKSIFNVSILISIKAGKTFLLGALLLFVISQFHASAQTDVTSTYLTNAGFDQLCNYLVSGTETVAPADPANVSAVTGWTIGASPAWSAAGTFEFGWGGSFNGESLPSNGSDGATGSGNGAVGFSVGWGVDVYYKQQVTLPAGKYSLNFATCFKGVDAINANLTGWVPNTGTAVLSDLSSVAALNTWETDSVIFWLLQETTGDIQVGMQSIPELSSSSNTRMFVDYVKLLSHPIKDDLQALVDSANVMLANQEPIPVGSTVYTDLATSISSAQGVLDNATATIEDIFAAQDVLNEAISIVIDIVAKNKDATLIDLKVNGVTIQGFSSEVEAYNFIIFTSSAEAPAVPAVTATKRSIYAATPVVTNASQVPGTTTILVTAGSGDTKTYSISFTFISVTVYENYTATFESLESKYLELSGKGQLTLTGSSKPLNGSAINLVSTDAWIYFPNMRPSQVVSSVLSSIMVNGEAAVLGSNIWVAQYLNGAMVIPHSPTYNALTVYSGSSQSGTSKDLMIDQRYRASELGTMNNDIESFILRRGYMATFASNQDGTGTSRVYIAKDFDIIVNTMPEGLSNTASLVVVRRWRWTAKKGWRGNASGAEQFNATSHYDYNNADNSTLDVEYVPMRHNPNWNSYNNFLNKYSSTHALGYNEPDNSVDDGYSTVKDAITNWPRMMESGLRLGSPAVTDGGLGWLYDFMGQCETLGYRVDFVAWHFYRRGNTAEQLYYALKDIHDRTGRPIWITEFNNGCNWTYDASHPVPSVEENGQIIDDFINMLDTTSFVERYYVWDGCNEELRMTNSSTGDLYPAGIAYRDLVSTISYTSDYYNDKGKSTIQENATGYCGADGTIDTDHSYTGSGFVNTTNAIGSGIDYKVISSSEGAKTISVKYAATENRPANFIVNGTVVASDVQFPSTGSLDSYAKIPVTVNTETGIVDIRIEATTSNGLGNIDYIEITEANGGDCSLTSDSYPVVIKASSEQDGNPASNLLDGNTADDSRWSAESFPQSAVIDYGEDKSIIGTRVSTFESRAYQYTVELDVNADFSSPSYTVDRSSNIDTDQPISDDFTSVTARYARITVTGASGYTGTWSSITEFAIVEDTVTPPSLIEQPMMSGKDKLILYPNPATDHVSISIPNNFENAGLFFFNSTGQIVKTLTLNSQTNLVSTGDLSEGIYIIKLVKESEVLTGKLIIAEHKN